MTIYIIASTDGDSGLYRLEVFASKKLAEQRKTVRERDDAYTVLREYVVKETP